MYSAARLGPLTAARGRVGAMPVRCRQRWMGPGIRCRAGNASPPDEESWEGLQALLVQATQREDFVAAASLRDRAAAKKASDPLLSVAAQLEMAIADERYQDAARLRDELKSLQPPPPPELAASSASVTSGVRVEVRSTFVAARSDPSSGAFFFSYAVRIINESNRTVQLISRRWMIRDSHGRAEEVKGPGVVGATPVLEPGGEFSYTSACPLGTSRGSMEGTYTMVEIGVDGMQGKQFEATIGKFGLIGPK